ncbi:MAG: tail protein X [Candidatus Gastranaerophilales bacterium]|nr:tail protein X [Candidatus Gastranaerophilales bacterium]
MQYSHYKEHITKQGDRWDTIAYKYYGDCFKYAPLVMANPTVAISPIIPTGIKLIVPVLSDIDATNEDLPPWKQ